MRTGEGTVLNIFSLRTGRWLQFAWTPQTVPWEFWIWKDIWCHLHARRLVLSWGSHLPESFKYLCPESYPTPGCSVQLSDSHLCVIKAVVLFLGCYCGEKLQMVTSLSAGVSSEGHAGWCRNHRGSGGIGSFFAVKTLPSASETMSYSQPLCKMEFLGLSLFCVEMLQEFYVRLQIL